MLFSSLNTGSTDLRDTEVQQPNTTATLSLVINSRAFSAKSGQSDAGSTTTASSFLPSSPPFLFCSSISISMTSFSVVSEIAIVPESECRMPTLIVSSSADATVANPSDAASATPDNSILPVSQTINFSQWFLHRSRRSKGRATCDSGRSDGVLAVPADLQRQGD